MKTFVSATETRITYSRGGGFLVLIGVPLLLLGVLFAVLPINENALQKAWGFACFVNGVFLALAGTALAFGRRTTVVDKSRNLVSQSWDLLVPLHTSWRPLSDYASVAVFERQPDRDVTRVTLYALSLRDRAGRDTVILYTPSPELARAGAEDLSRFLGYPFP